MNNRPLTFVIYGDPKGQGRPKFARVGTRTVAYDPKESREQKAFVKLVAQAAMADAGWTCVPQGVPVSVTITAYFGFNKSDSKRFIKAALEGKVRPTKKPDVDNLQKLIYDAISKGIVYHDDNQIVESYCHKYYDEEPRIVVRVEMIGVDNE